MKFNIKDWANNTLFNGKTFETFEDGWSFIYEHIDNEEEYDDYFVMEVDD